MRLVLSMVLLFALWVEGLAGVSAGGWAGSDQPGSSCCRACTCADRSCCSTTPARSRPAPNPLARPSASTREDLVSPPLPPRSHLPCLSVSAPAFLPPPVLLAPAPDAPAVPRYLSVLTLLL